MRDAVLAAMAALLVSGCGAGAVDGPGPSPLPERAPPRISLEPLPDDVRAKKVQGLKWGMFVCWSFSTFSGREWTPTRDKDASYFRATGSDTDQWARTAREAGMGYILFLTKHHDGFCLWDTETTGKKVTNSPLGIDVLAKLRASCDRYGIRLAMYFSEGDWSWPGAVDGKGGRGGGNPETKKAQLRELCTRYGPVEFFWMDHAVGDGGLGHKETVAWVHRFQPNCFVGFNHGKPAGRLCIRERGRPGPIGDARATRYNVRGETSFRGYLVAEFTYPILPRHKGGAQWFYSLPEHDNLCHPAEKVYRDYAGAVRHGNIFSIDVGPDYEGRLRVIDVKTLREVGEMIRNPPPPPPPSLTAGKRATASGTWSSPGYEADKAFDGEESTRWGCSPGSRSGWLEVDLGAPATFDRVEILEEPWNRVRRFRLEYLEGDTWKTFLEGTRLGTFRKGFEPVTARRVRLNVTEAVEVPTIWEVRLLAPKGKE